MPLNKEILKQGIKALAENTAKNAGGYGDFASGLADLIEAFVKSGTVTVQAGITVSTAGSATSQTGTTTSTGTGNIS